MAKLPEDSNVPPDARASHPSFQSSEPNQPAIDPDPEDELDGDVVEFVLRELDGLDEPDDDPNAQEGTLYAFGGNAATREAADVYDYEGSDGDGEPTAPTGAAQSIAGFQADTRPDDDLDTWIEPDEDWFDDTPEGPSRGSIASVESTGSIAATRSAGSIASALSAGSIASAVSAGSIASLVSVGSFGSILSIGSVRSLLSIGSRNSILSIGAEDGFLTIGRGRNARSLRPK